MLKAHRNGAQLTVVLSMELDHHHADLARAQLEEMLSDQKIRELVFDLSELSFMDSSGIGFILGRVRTMQKRGGTVAVRGVRPHVDRIMRLSGLYRIVEEYSDGVGGA